MNEQERLSEVSGDGMPDLSMPRLEEGDEVSISGTRGGEPFHIDLTTPTPTPCTCGETDCAHRGVRIWEGK